MITDKAMSDNVADCYGFRSCGMPFILTGKSPSGDWNHSVVQWDEGDEVKQYDPHPRDKGVMAPLADIIILVPLRAYE